MNRNDGLTVAVVGATGVVGRELLETLERRHFPVRALLPFNSGRSPSRVRFRSRFWPIGRLPGAIACADLVLLASSDAVALRMGRSLAARGAWVIDDSTAFRMDPSVPLVIPEVNVGALSPRRRLIAGPNCTMTGAAVAGWPLVRAAGLRAVRIASYQAVSGAGRAATEEFEAQARAWPRRLKAKALPRLIARNVIPQVGSFNGKGEASEEIKVRSELRKVWGLPRLAVSVTAVRVPVSRGHCLALWLELKRPLSPARARALLRKAPGVKLWPESSYPTPLEAGGTWPVHAARVRRGASANELCLWVLSDNLLKGAALNTVQIAEALLKKGWLKPRGGR